MYQYPYDAMSRSLISILPPTPCRAWDISYFKTFRFRLFEMLYCSSHRRIHTVTSLLQPIPLQNAYKRYDGRKYYH